MSAAVAGALKRKGPGELVARRLAEAGEASDVDHTFKR